MTLGTVASWWYCIQAGFVQNSLLLIAGLLKGINFIYCFYLGMFFDDMVLLIGCWLLGKRYLKHDLSVLFYCVTVWGGALWLTQPWYNFHNYYCLPLILHFLHSFLETGRWRYFLGGCHLMLMQALGNLPYIFPVITFVIFLYFFMFVLFNGYQFKKFIKRVRFSGAALLSFCVLGTTCYLVFTATAYGTDQILNYNVGRELNGSTKLENFLTYAGNLNLNKWKELALGFSPELDYNLYGGIIVVPLLVWVLIYRRTRRILPVLGLVVLLLDFSLGGWTAAIAYRFWPLMKYYRHVALISAIIKIFIFLAAAYAFDYLARFDPKNVPTKRFISVVPAGIIVLLALGLLNQLPSIGDLIWKMIPGRWDLLVFQRIYAHVINERLMCVFILSVLSAALWIVWAGKGSPKKRTAVLIFIIFLHIVDVGMFKIYESTLRSVPLGDLKPLLSFQKMPFAKNRELPENWQNSPRAAMIKSLPLMSGVEYWSNDSFLFRDSAGHPFRTDHWLLPLDQFMRAYWGQRINDFSVKPLGLAYYYKLDLPVQTASARKMIGLDEEKIQFFSEALFSVDEQAIASSMISSQYQGDIPIILDGQKNTLKAGDRLNENARVKFSYTADDFSSDHLKLTVNSGSAGWLLYSDVWHPYWHAVVNGKEVEVKRANLAFKIIPLEKGVNNVYFYFNSSVISYVQILLELFSLMWVVIISFMGVRIVSASKQNPFKIARG